MPTMAIRQQRTYSTISSTKGEAALYVDMTVQIVAVKIPILYLRYILDTLVPRSASEWVRHSNMQTQVIDVDAPYYLPQTNRIFAGAAIYENRPSVHI
jgi:hypothetical protein